MRESLPEDEVAARIEAALYSAGRPLTVDELVRASGTNSKEKTMRVVNDLVKKTKTVFKAIEVVQLEDGSYVFQLKPAYTPLIRRFAQHPLVPAAALKTLTYIAYEQPVTSKRLVQIRGSQVYQHIKELEQMEFVEHESLGRLKVYRTTKKFQEYFGITDLNSMKSKLVAETNKENPRQQPPATTTTASSKADLPS
ncbi:condensin subunit ScpB [Candidatus Nitrososphaera evergladensis SR1]|jgi:segregation and condensation protein B|uniref:Condensin subunit ScpB n=1 Tax=Candidatus Nitrososphaera evergladensis SR1 TaxID=1459636 RepID=A0A075MSI2_9ARCH|nr:SMC-Scp complex subunit ScpB [Candidatus Nitrososphaera evergladensis]AIF84118.1 condensin subunit ScpB [Candidatus Nitrososphaera evergladensis SR1]